MLGEVGLAETEVEGIMKKADTDGSGTIDYSEFVMACINLKKLLNKEQLQYAFSQFDKVRGELRLGRKWLYFEIRAEDNSGSRRERKCG